ncbi:hypothetical protein BST91_07985 [Nonlabens tegetincola]|uniref:glycosyltransferase family 2 protein n=1 Tax=Nonlabens tegetincola TaxID=323273 RepID=UPI000A2061FF|nr:glycosyltransferase family 2 protein [Nonlabens tegetincola]ARN71584.1 hypothetical protein BST91_07985 [Nonlabens tegetincola]
MYKDLISIILPVYNGEQYISECIDSCLNQTYQNWELIIVNDCSTDNTPVILSKYIKKDQRLKLYNNKANLKLPKSLNLGHEMAKGEYLTWISHDNILKRNFLEEMIEEIIKSNSDIVYSNFSVINGDGILQEKRVLSNLNNFLLGNPVQASFVYKRIVYNHLNGYKDHLFLIEDYDFWLRSSICFKISHLSKDLYFFRKHKDSLTTSIKKNQARYNLFSNNLSRCFSELNLHLNAHTIEFLVLLHSYSEIWSRKINVNDIKNIHSFFRDIEIFCLKIKIDSHQQKLNIKKRIREIILFKGKVEFTLLFYLIIFRPNAVIKNNKDILKLVKSYFSNE